MYNDELMHYGVPGMRWGHRKQYPTVGIIPHGNRQRMNQPTSSPKMTKNQVGNKSSNNPGSQKQPMSTKKKAAIAATAVAGTALAAYGAYKVSKFIKTKNVQIAMEKGNKLAAQYLNDNKLHMNSISKFKDGTYQAMSSNASGSNLASYGRMSKEGLASVTRNIGEHNARVMNTANGLKNQTINKATNDNLLSATKNVARYYKNKRRF